MMMNAGEDYDGDDGDNSSDDELANLLVHVNSDVLQWAETHQIRPHKHTAFEKHRQTTMKIQIKQHYSMVKKNNWWRSQFILKKKPPEV